MVKFGWLLIWRFGVFGFGFSRDLLLCLHCNRHSQAGDALARRSTSVRAAREWRRKLPDVRTSACQLRSRRSQARSSRAPRRQCNTPNSSLASSLRIPVSSLEGAALVCSPICIDSQLLRTAAMCAVGALDCAFAASVRLADCRPSLRAVASLPPLLSPSRAQVSPSCLRAPKYGSIAQETNKCSNCKQIAIRALAVCNSQVLSVGRCTQQ